MGQSTQTMHMLTKPQAFYDESHKTTLGYQNPFYLSQARREVPTLYDGHTIVKTHDALYVTDTEETLELAEESRLKMLAKQNDPSLKEKKVNIAPVDYVALNKLSEHFVKHFFRLRNNYLQNMHFGYLFHNSFYEKPPVLSEPVLKKEIPRELPPISLMFEHGLYKELKEMKAIFNQMETEVAKYFVDKKYFDIKKKELSLDNDRILEHIICQDVMNIVMHANDHSNNVLPAHNNSLEHDNSALELLKHENDHLMELLISQDLVHTAVNSLTAINDYKTMKQSFLDEYDKTLVLKAKLAKQNDMIKKVEFFIINELQAQLKAKNVSIEKLKEHIANIKGKNVVESVQNVQNSNVVTLKVYKLDLQPLSPLVKHNRDAYVDYLKHTQKNADILHEIVEHAKELRPLDSNLDSTCKFVTRIQELLVYVHATCPSLKPVSNKLVAVTPINRERKVRVSSSTKACGSKPRSNTKKDRISQTSSSNNKKNKVEAQPRIAKSSLNNTNRVSKTVCNENVKHFALNANSKLICATCHECMFDAIHDLCVSDYLNDVNARYKSKSVKSKSAKSKKKKIWKPTGKVYTNVRYSWKPTGRTFTIDGNTCPLTRIISTKVVPPRKSTSTTPVKQKQPSSNKSRKLKDITNVGSSSKSKTVGRTNRTLVPGLGLLQEYDQGALSAHQLH
ncbi:hypothetical protein Tco_1299461 [Tanacetum coccineum]